MKSDKKNISKKTKKPKKEEVMKPSSIELSG